MLNSLSSEGALPISQLLVEETESDQSLRGRLLTELNEKIEEYWRLDNDFLKLCNEGLEKDPNSEVIRDYARLLASWKVLDPERLQSCAPTMAVRQRLAAYLRSDEMNTVAAMNLRLYSPRFVDSTWISPATIETRRLDVQRYAMTSLQERNFITYSGTCIQLQYFFGQDLAAVSFDDGWRDTQTMVHDEHHFDWSSDELRDRGVTLMFGFNLRLLEDHKHPLTVPQHWYERALVYLEQLDEDVYVEGFDRVLAGIKCLLAKKVHFTTDGISVEMPERIAQSAVPPLPAVRHGISKTLHA